MHAREHVRAIYHSCSILRSCKSNRASLPTYSLSFCLLVLLSSCLAVLCPPVTLNPPAVPVHVPGPLPVFPSIFRTISFSPQMGEPEHWDVMFKLIIIGDTGTGKPEQQARAASGSKAEAPGRAHRSSREARSAQELLRRSSFFLSRESGGRSAPDWLIERIELLSEEERSAIRV